MATRRAPATPVTVKVAIVPGECKEIALNGDRTVQAALDLAGFESEGHVIQVNGQAADLDTMLESGAFVSLTKQIKGNE